MKVKGKGGERGKKKCVLIPPWPHMLGQQSKEWSLTVIVIAVAAGNIKSC